MPALGLAVDVDQRRTQPFVRVLPVAFTRTLGPQIRRTQPREHAQEQTDRTGMPTPRPLVLTAPVHKPDRQRRQQRAPEDLEHRVRIVAYADGLAEHRHQHEADDRRTFPAQPRRDRPFETDAVHPLRRRPHRAQQPAPAAPDEQHRQKHQRKPQRPDQPVGQPAQFGAGLARQPHRSGDQRQKPQCHRRMDPRQIGAQRHRGPLQRARRPLGRRFRRPHGNRERLHADAAVRLCSCWRPTRRIAA